MNNLLKHGCTLFVILCDNINSVCVANQIFENFMKTDFVRFHKRKRQERRMENHKGNYLYALIRSFHCYSYLVD